MNNGGGEENIVNEEQISGQNHNGLSTAETDLNSLLVNQDPPIRSSTPSHNVTKEQNLDAIKKFSLRPPSQIRSDPQTHSNLPNTVTCPQTQPEILTLDFARLISDIM